MSACRFAMIASGQQAIPLGCPTCGIFGACRLGLPDPYKPQGEPPNTGSGVQPPAHLRPKGCICPPTSEQTCQAWDCPRKAPPSGPAIARTGGEA